MAISRDSCVVDTAPLAQLLQGFITTWNVSRPAVARGGTSNGGRFTPRAERPVEEVGMVSAVSWLAAETGVPESTIEKVARGRSKTTELRIADPLVQALDRPQAYHDGTLTIRPNPLAPRTVRARCCGGSGG